MLFAYNIKDVQVSIKNSTNISHNNAKNKYTHLNRGNTLFIDKQIGFSGFDDITSSVRSKLESVIGVQRVHTHFSHASLNLIPWDKALE